MGTVGCFGQIENIKRQSLFIARRNSHSRRYETRSLAIRPYTFLQSLTAHISLLGNCRMHMSHKWLAMWPLYMCLSGCYRPKMHCLQSKWRFPVCLCLSGCCSQRMYSLQSKLRFPVCLCLSGCCSQRMQTIQSKLRFPVCLCLSGCCSSGMHSLQSKWRFPVCLCLSGCCSHKRSGL